MLKRPVRALHSVGSLNRGGIETWLMNLVRQRSEDVHFDFILAMPGGVYEEEAKQYGCRIYHQPLRSRMQKRLDILGIGTSSRFLESVLAKQDYDAIHVHGDEFFGESMKIGAACGVPVRVAHCHNTQLARGKRGPEMLIRRLRFETLDRWNTLKYATNIVACSSDAGRYFMGTRWGADPRCRPIYCAVTLEQFSASEKRWTRQAYRAAHRIPEDAIVIGHVGSMDLTPQKNHALLLAIFKVLARRSDRYYLYLAGDGPRRTLLEAEIKATGLSDRVFMPGLCEDVPSLMVHGFDVHLLPSLFEGLPVVGLEAVASGLHTVCSNTITTDFTNYFQESVTTVSLDAPTTVWADQTEVAVHRRKPMKEGVALLESSPFSICSSLESLTHLYSEVLQPRAQSRVAIT